MAEDLDSYDLFSRDISQARRIDLRAGDFTLLLFAFFWC
jgi:hypothetical protein